MRRMSGSKIRESGTLIEYYIFTVSWVRGTSSPHTRIHLSPLLSRLADVFLDLIWITEAASVLDVTHERVSTMEEVESTTILASPVLAQDSAADPRRASALPAVAFQMAL